MKLDDEEAVDRWLAINVAVYATIAFVLVLMTAFSLPSPDSKTTWTRTASPESVHALNGRLEVDARSRK